jgi:hypothetical protein
VWNTAINSDLSSKQALPPVHAETDKLGTENNFCNKVETQKLYCQMLFRKEGESAYHQNILDAYNFVQSISNYAIRSFKNLCLVWTLDRQQDKTEESSGF